jgi:hypothetical protein
MSPLGNLAIVCAKRPDVTLVVANGSAVLIVGEGEGQEQRTAEWQDDAGIERLIQELNYGELRAEDANT